MHPHTTHSFELRRFPDLRSRSFKMLGGYLALIVWQHWIFALSIVGLLFIYRFWRLQRPADQLRLTDTEIVLRRLQISKQQVAEVSPTATGVIIAWKKAGVPHYTHVKSAWFEEAVWRKACPALLAWVPSQ